MFNHLPPPEPSPTLVLTIVVMVVAALVLALVISLAGPLWLIPLALLQILLGCLIGILLVCAALS